MKIVLASLATAVVASFGFVAPAATASPSGGGSDSPNCVTRAEYRSIQTGNDDGPGTRKARVHRIFDTRGAYLGEGRTYVTRNYERCGRHRRDDVIVDFTKQAGVWRASFKGLVNLP